ncbi:MAG: hypothetical protein ACP5XB_20660, partial [Isosphaeraceae bacterium]
DDRSPRMFTPRALYDQARLCRSFRMRQFVATLRPYRATVLDDRDDLGEPAGGRRVGRTK